MDPSPQAHAVLAAAREALASPWHLAVLTGPDAGAVLPLAPGRTVLGRGGALTGPHVSRRHLEVVVEGARVTLRGAGATNPVRWSSGHRWHRLTRPTQVTEGTWIRLGDGLAQLRRRPLALDLPAPGAPAQGRWHALLPLAVGLVLTVTVGTTLLRGTGSGSWAAAAGSLPLVLLMALRLVPRGRGQAPGAPARGVGAGGSRRRRPRGRLRHRGRRAWPADAPTLLLAVAARHPGAGGGAGTGAGTRAAEAGGPRAWLDSRGRQPLALSPGQRTALDGTGAPAALRWWAAQALTRPGLTVEALPDGLRLSWGREEPPAELLICRDGTVPARALTVLPAPRHHPPPPASQAWWEALLLASGAVPASTLGPTSPAGTVAHLDDVVPGTSRQAVERQWEEARGDHRRTLAAVLGTAPGRRLVVDLVEHGPHALVAGTTGSGKSELLVSWLTQLALRTPPSHLCLVLVDYKGGAAFGPLARLPHTAGVLTDLDPAGTTRALGSLQAEVRRRERLLRHHGAKDLRGLPDGAVPARLVIAVDEYAQLAAEHPDVLDALVRVAAQGRSLGLHLVLASQRPSGSTTPAIRANAPLRLCLRVLDPQDSHEVLGHPGAASLPEVPGSFLALGGRVEEERHGAGPTAGTTDGGAADGTLWRAPWCGDEEALEAVVDAVREAAAVAPGGRWQAWRPWAEPLPARLRRPPGRGDAAHVLLARTDLPEEQALGWWSWDTTHPLLVLGPTRSGRSTALASAASALLTAGRAVHVLGAAGRLPPLDTAHGHHPRLGTVLAPGSTRLTTRLLTLAADGSLAGDALLLDDVDLVLGEVDEQLGPGEGAGLLSRLIRSAPATGTALLLAGPLASATARWATALPDRLVLGASQPWQAAAAGLPHGVLTGDGPGRGLLLQGPRRVPAQVLLPGHEEPGGQVGACPGTAAGAPGGPAHRPVLRLVPLPPPSASPTGGAAPDGPPPWAVGGDGAVALPPPGGSVLVVGPPGSGRSTALAALRRNLEGVPGGCLVVDDLDLAAPDLVAEAEEAVRAGGRVLASATTERAASCLRGPLHLLRERADLVILSPGAGPASALASTSLRAAWEPRALGTPGRGVLVSRGQALPIQVISPRESVPGRPGSPHLLPPHANEKTFAHTCLQACTAPGPTQASDLVRSTTGRHRE